MTDFYLGSYKQQLSLNQVALDLGNWKTQVSFDCLLRFHHRDTAKGSYMPKLFWGT